MLLLLQLVEANRGARADDERDQTKDGQHNVSDQHSDANLDHGENEDREDNQGVEARDL